MRRHSSAGDNHLRQECLSLKDMSQEIMQVLQDFKDPGLRRDFALTPVSRAQPKGVLKRRSTSPSPARLKPQEGPHGPQRKLGGTDQRGKLRDIPHELEAAREDKTLTVYFQAKHAGKGVNKDRVSGSLAVQQDHKSSVHLGLHTESPSVNKRLIPKKQTPALKQTPFSPTAVQTWDSECPPKMPKEATPRRPGSPGIRKPAADIRRPVSLCPPSQMKRASSPVDYLRPKSPLHSAGRRARAAMETGVPIIKIDAGSPCCSLASSGSSCSLEEDLLRFRDPSSPRYLVPPPLSPNITLSVPASDNSGLLYPGLRKRQRSHSMSNLLVDEGSQPAWEDPDDLESCPKSPCIGRQNGLGGQREGLKRYHRSMENLADDRVRQGHFLPPIPKGTSGSGTFSRGPPPSLDSFDWLGPFAKQCRRLGRGGTVTDRSAVETRRFCASPDHFTASGQ